MFGISLGIPYIHSRGTGAAAFTPASLFASSEDGGWWDPSDLTSVFQERTGASATTAASVGDPVGTILDLSGNANHMTAAADAERPILRQDGSNNYYLEFDGTDDALSTSMTGLSSSSMVMTGIYIDTSKSQHVLHRGQSSGFYFPNIQNNTVTSGLNNGIGSSYTLRDDGAEIVWVERRDTWEQAADEITLWTFETMDMSSWTAFGTSNYTAIEMQGRWYGTILLDRALTTQERSDSESFMAGKTGVTLN